MIIEHILISDLRKGKRNMKGNSGSAASTFALTPPISLVCCGFLLRSTWNIVDCIHLVSISSLSSSFLTGLLFICIVLAYFGLAYEMGKPKASIPKKKHLTMVQKMEVLQPSDQKVRKAIALSTQGRLRFMWVTVGFANCDRQEIRLRPTNS